MKTVSEEMIAAYVDGELPADEAARVEQAQKSDASVRASIARYQALRAEIDQSFGLVIREKIPARLRKLFKTDKSTQRRKVPSPRSSGWRRSATWLTPAAIAASFTFGVFFGAAIDRSGHDELRFAADGTYSSRSIIALLEGQPSGAEDGDVKMVTTFRNNNGDICREFDVGRTKVAHVLACRQSDGAWPVVALAPVPPPGSYLLAGGERNQFKDIMQDFVELSGDEEQRLLEKGWKD